MDKNITNLEEQNIQQMDKDFLIKYSKEKLPLMFAMKEIPKEIINKISEEIEYKFYNENQIIIPINNKKEKELFFIIEGICIAYDKNGRILRYLFPGDNFGEIFFFNKSKERTAYIKSYTKIKCLILKRNTYDNSALSNCKEFSFYMNSLFKRRYNQIKLDDLFCIKFLFKSNLSRYFLVHDIKNIYQIKLEILEL